MAPSINSPRPMTPAVQVWGTRYKVHPTTFDRWMNDSRLGFPKPVKIRGRNYFYDDELDAFDARQRTLRGEAA